MQEVKSAMIQVDPTKIVPKIVQFIQNIEQKSEHHLYLGVTSVEEKYKRLSRHNNTHGNINAEIIASYDSRQAALVVEAIGIAYLKSNKQSFGSVLNISDGFEHMDFLGCGAIKRIYVFSTRTPFAGRDKEATGILKKPAHPTVAHEGYVRCFHCGTLILEGGNVSQHMALHMRINFECQYCGLKNLASFDEKRKHEETHTEIIRCAKMSCDKLGPIGEMIRYHFPACFPSLYEESTVICQAILEKQISTFFDVSFNKAVAQQN